MSHHEASNSTEIASGTSQKTLKAYLIGFSLSLILTFASFVVAGITGHRFFSDASTYVGLAVLAVSQLFVQVIFFLRINTSEQGRWNLMSFLFTILIIGVVVAGSLWIMYNLNYNMISH